VLPPTSIRDIVIKDDDLLAGTHGRGFWILDDITPLRALTADILEKIPTARDPWQIVNMTPGVQLSGYNVGGSQSGQQLTPSVRGSTANVQWNLEGGSITEGIGLGRVTPIIDGLKVDKAYLIPDEEALPLIFELLEHEGLCLGGSSGINVAGAIRLAKELGPGKTIVTILADYGTRYQSKLFSPDFLRSKKLPVPDWLERKSNIKPPFEKT